MKRSLFFLISLLPLIAAAQIKEVGLSGLRQIRCSSANVNAVCEADGLLFFALQQGVQVLLQDRMIASFPYNELTGGTENGRYDRVRLRADIANRRVLVTDKHGTVAIYSEESAASNIAKMDGSADSGDSPLAGGKFFLRPNSEGHGYYLSTSSGQQLLPEPIWDAVENKFRSTPDTTALLLATVDSGLYQVKISSDQVSEIIRYIIPTAFGGNLSTVRSLAYIEQSHSVLIGTIGEHAFLWSQQHQEVFRPWIMKGVSDIKYNHFWSSARVDDQRFLAGNDIGQILLLDRRTNRLISEKLLQPGVQIRAIAHLKGNTYLAGGIQAASGKGVLWSITLHDDLLLADTLPLPTTAAVYAFCKDRYSSVPALLIGTEKGLFRYTATGEMEVLHPDISAQFVQADPEGKGYFMGGNSGLFYRPADGEPTKLVHEQLDGASFSHVIPVKTRQGRSALLITTRNKYFFLAGWDSTRRKITTLEQFGEQKGMTFFPESGGAEKMITVYGGVNLAGLHTAWLSTNFGLIAFDYHRKSLAFYEQTGIPAMEFNTNAFHLQNDSTAIFGSIKGLVQVNANKAQAYSTTRLVQPQLWEVRNSTDEAGDSIFSGKELFVKYTEDSIVRLNYEDDERRFFLAASDYSMLSRNVFTRISGTDTLKIHDDRILPAQGVFGRFREGSFLDIIRRPFGNPGVDEILLLQSGMGLLSINFRQSFSKAYRSRIMLFVAIALLAITVFTIVLIYNTKKKIAGAKQALEDEQNNYLLRQQLFTGLGDKLDQADGYPGIQSAFQTITAEEMHDILNATKISLFRYQQSNNTLQLIGHSDAKPAAGENNSLAEEVNGVVFDIEKEKNYPVVHLWEHRGRYQRKNEACLVVNRAKKEFYEANDLLRPVPKRGKPTESFLFMLIGSDLENKEPFGVISIQNEKPDAFLNERGVDQYIFLLKQIGRLAYFKVGEIEQKIGNLLFVSRSQLYKNRLEAHFFGDLISSPKKIIEFHGIELGKDVKRDLYSFGDKTRQLFKQIYASDSLIDLENEVKLCEAYVSLKNRMNSQDGTGRTVVFTADIAGGDKDKSIPSLILLNLVHNSYRAATDPSGSDRQQPKVEIRSETTGDDLQVSVADNGPGFPEHVLQQLIAYRDNRIAAEQKSSLYLIMDLLEELRSAFGGDPRIDLCNLTDERSGSMVSITIPLAMIDQYRSVLNYSINNSSNPKS